MQTNIPESFQKAALLKGANSKADISLIQSSCSETVFPIVFNHYFGKIQTVELRFFFRTTALNPHNEFYYYLVEASSSGWSSSSVSHVVLGNRICH